MPQPILRCKVIFLYVLKPWPSKSSLNICPRTYLVFSIFDCSAIFTHSLVKQLSYFIKLWPPILNFTEKFSFVYFWQQPDLWQSYQTFVYISYWARKSRFVRHWRFLTNLWSKFTGFMLIVCLMSELINPTQFVVLTWRLRILTSPSQLNA